MVADTATTEGEPTQGMLTPSWRKLAGEDAEIVLEGEVSTEHVGAGLFHRKHDGREILALLA